ncbi:MAG: hypothetical protein E6446_07640 [Gemella haemolysans]|nr:hypothetical protein [Gemella haemolysans]
METRYNLKFKWNDEKLVMNDKSLKEINYIIYSSVDCKIRDVETEFIENKIKNDNVVLNYRNFNEYHSNLTENDYKMILDIYFKKNNIEYELTKIEID